MLAQKQMSITGGKNGTTGAGSHVLFFRTREVMALADRILVMADGRITADSPGAKSPERN